MTYNNNGNQQGHEQHQFGLFGSSIQMAAIALLEYPRPYLIVSLHYRLAEQNTLRFAKPKLTVYIINVY